MTDGSWKVAGTPTPKPAFRTKIGDAYKINVGALHAWARFLLHSEMNLGPVGQAMLGEYFACGKTAPGLMRLDLRNFLAVIEGSAGTLLVHTPRQSHLGYASTLVETETMLGEVREAIGHDLKARSHEHRLTALDLGLLAGEFYARNRHNGNTPPLMTLLDVISQQLRGQLEKPVELYLGASIAFRRKGTIADINDYAEAVARKFGISAPEQKRSLHSQMALLIMGRAGTFPKLEEKIIFWLSKAGYNLDQKADFLAGLAAELQLETAQSAKLVQDVADKRKLLATETRVHFSERFSRTMGYQPRENDLFKAYLAKHHYFEPKRG